MAFYDAERNLVVIRVVYDGMGTAGKTTNIDKIWELFSVAREGDVYTPETLRGRTLYFDWLELHAGRLLDRPVRCQVITVPGQFAYAQRRWELLRFPDAIVAVCDSTPEALARTRLGYRFLAHTLRQREMTDVPVIVQANKQDAFGALPVDALASALALDESAKIVPACARDGTGVRKTLMAAIHAAVERVRDRVDRLGLAGLDRYDEGPEELYRRLKAHEDSGELERGAELADRLLAEEV